MRLFKECAAICLQNFRKWTTDYKIWITAIILCILVHSYWSDISIINQSLGMKSSPWIFPFLYSQFYMKLLFTLPLILIFCNAPFIDSNQIFVIMRSGHRKWIISQILYIIFASAIYYIFIFALSILIGLPYSDWQLEWGKVINTISVTNAAQNNGVFFVEMSPVVTRFFDPIQACWFTFLLSWLCGIFLGLIIFLLNLITNTKFAGITVSASFTVFSFMVANGDLGFLLKYSPVSWNTLNNLDVGKITPNPSFVYCLLVYLMSAFVLISVILLAGKKSTIDIAQQ